MLSVEVLESYAVKLLRGSYTIADRLDVRASADLFLNFNSCLLNT